ncbi:hypothetical protein EDB80DRAFT_171194 [Ilyonectria destructans]|nr:hypothetical protein EDB80DRAFT_171194 [Ilyonectria destructans]
MPSNSPTEHVPQMNQSHTFLGLPAEIRLQIYHWVHLDHAVEHAELDPGYLIPPKTVYMTRPIRTDPAAQLSLGQVSSQHNSSPSLSATSNQHDHALLSQKRPISRIPTSLLVVNKQVYLEARGVPFLENEFVFVNWFSSGLSSAKAFIAVLAPWQRALLRYARLEALIIDFRESERENCTRLCRLLSLGLWGLRLRVQERDTISNSSRSENDHQANISPTIESSWKLIASALAEIKALRSLEVELSIAGWSDAQKTLWCRSVEEFVNSTKAETERRLRVICVESEIR